MKFFNVSGVMPDPLGVSKTGAHRDPRGQSSIAFISIIDANCAGQHSVRINDQFRVCFIWTPHRPKDVDIVDYH